MFWLGIAIGAAALLVVVGIVVVRRRARTEGSGEYVDPLFVTGIAVMGAGAALVTTLGAVMYVVIAGGLVLMAVGARRARRGQRG